MGHGALVLVSVLLVAHGLEEANKRVHHWPYARGHMGSYMLTEETLPRNFSSAFAWSFHPPEGRRTTVMRGNPIIDYEKNVLISTQKAIFKLSQDGKPLWEFPCPRRAIGCLLVVVPSLLGEVVYGATNCGLLFALNLHTGQPIWQEKHSEFSGGDTHYVEAKDGIVLAAVDCIQVGEGGNKRVIGVNASNGSLLWEFRPETPTWNFSPLHVGDGTFIFMDLMGGVNRVWHNNGTKVWFAQVVGSFTDGGVMLNPDGSAAFTCSHRGSDLEGVLRRYRMEDGKLEWAKNLPTGCTSWPALSKSGDFGVVAAGSFVTSPLVFHLPHWMPDPVKVILHLFSLAMGDHMAKLIPIRRLRTDVIAFDPRTGETLWSYTTPAWRRLAAKGDEEGVLSRLGGFCLPTSWGTPTISGDGTIHVGHVSGLVYGVKDHNGDGRIDPETEVATFDMCDAPLPNNPAWAPGMMAVASCDAMFVFKT